MTDDGGAAVTGRGICYSTTENPTISNNRTADGSGTGSFTSSLTSLTPDTEYYVRAYVSNSVGTVYGNQVTFTTLPLEVVTDIDGNTYHAVIIGTQVWMVENLKTTKLNDGTELRLATNDHHWENLNPFHEAYVWYDNDSASFRTPYGAFYNWLAVNSGKLCPAGFHVPTDADWTTLISFLGDDVAGSKLKEAGTSHWESPNSDATNETFFTALPGGICYIDGSFSWFGYDGYWWSTTETDYENSTVYGRIMQYVSTEVPQYISSTKFGMSVRCLKD